jgi:predicted transcriptional regulator
MNKYDKLEEEQLLFNFILQERPDLFNEINSDFFEIQDIQSLYMVYQSHYKDFGIYPSPLIATSKAKELGFEIDKIVFQTCIFNKTTWDEKYTRQIDWIKEKFTERHKIYYLKSKHWETFNAARELQEGKIKDIAGYISPLEETEEQEDTEKILENTSVLNNEIFENLPTFLKEVVNDKIGRERDVLLLSELSIVSYLFPTVSSYYWDYIYPNIYLFIAAPAGSLKSAVKKSFETLYDVEKAEREELKTQAALNDKIKRYSSIIPGDASKAAFEAALTYTEGIGLIYETEADRMNDNKGKDWGDYSTALRQAWSHETIRAVRKTDEGCYISTPKLSICLTGTINQLLKLYEKSGSEDGLFSRFLYYTYDQEPKFLNGFIKREPDGYYKKLSTKLKDIVDFYKKSPSEIVFTTEQIDNIMDQLITLHNNYIVLKDKGFAAVIQRLATATIKIVMILTIFRHYENKIIGSSDLISVDNTDIKTGIEILECLLEHSSIVYDNINKNNNPVIVKDKKEKFIDKLPNTFSRAEAIFIGKKMNLSQATIDRTLKRMLDMNKIIKKDKFTYVIKFCQRKPLNL